MNTSPLPDPDSPTAWMADGRCRMYPPETFFPSDGAIYYVCGVPSRTYSSASRRACSS